MFWWVRFAAKIFPRQGFRTALSKALSEQISVDPSCIVTFLFVMSLLERKTIVEAKEEVSHHLFFICTTNCFYAFVLLFSCTCVRICAFVLTIVCIFNSIDSSKQFLFQVRNKFFDTYKVGAIYWPTVQTVYIFFCFILNCIFFYLIFNFFNAFLYFPAFLVKLCVRPAEKSSCVHKFLQYDLERISSIRKAFEITKRKSNPIVCVWFTNIE